MTVATYRVLAGSKPFGGLLPGTLVLLSDVEAAGLLDKLELVEDSTVPEAEAEPKPEPKRKRSTANAG